MLLGRKKRGFGAGMIMGLGGKAGPGEADAACAVREVGEVLPGQARRVDYGGNAGIMVACDCPAARCCA